MAALKKLDPHFAVALGVFLLALFPVLGSACVFAVIPGARRYAQVALFAAGLALVAVPKFRGNYGQIINGLRATALLRALGAGSLLLAAVCTWNLCTLHAMPSAYEAVSIAAVWGWICLAAAVLVCRRSLSCATDMPSPREGLSVHGSADESAPNPDASGARRIPAAGAGAAFRRLLVVLGVCLAVAGWLSGPPDNTEAHISFGGSTISVGTGGAIGFGLSLLLFPFPRNLLASACWAYLLVFSTARTAVAVGGVLYIAYFGRELFCSPGAIWLRLGKACFRWLAALAIPFLLVLPIGTRCHYYPYFSPKANEDLLEYREEEFVRRFSRLYRVLPFMNVYHIPERGPDIFWCTASGTWQPRKVAVLLDAGAEASVHKVSLAPSVDYPELFPKEFVLEGTLDGKHWSTLASEKSYQPMPGQAYDVVFEPRPLRIVRLRASSARYANGRHYLVLGEFDLFGTGPLLRVARAEASGAIHAEYTANFAIDQDFSTYWHSPIHPAAAEEWLRLDMGAVVEVNRIRLWPAQRYPQLFPSQFTLEGSLDGKQWQPWASETDFDAIKHQPYEATVDKLRARFVRLRGASPEYTPVSHCMLVAEAELFGQLLPLPVTAQARQNAVFEDGEYAVLTLDLAAPQLLNSVRLAGAKAPGQVLLETQGAGGAWELAARVSLPATDVFFEARSAGRVRARTRVQSQPVAFEMQPFYNPGSLPVRVISSGALAAPMLESTPTYRAELWRGTAEGRNANYYVDLVQKLQTAPDDRAAVLAKTLAVTTERLTGQWPLPYREKTKCAYRYPHNFTLEIAYYAGWPVAIIATWALAVMVFWGLRTISTSLGLVELILAVCVVAFAVRMQLTSDLLDHVNVLLLCWLLVLRKTGRVQEAACQ